MDPNHSMSDFQTTHWGMVYGARGDRSGLEQLLRRYWSPVYSFIRRQGYGGHDASDLTQDFLAKVVIGRDIVGKADPSRGRFRSFLKQALRNFLIDQHRTHRHSKGGVQRPDRTGGGGVSLSEGSTAAAPEAFGEDPTLSAQFDREWAATIVHLTLQRLEDACRRDGLASHWEAFRINILGPTLHGTDPIDLATLAEHLGATGADQVSNMIQTTKRKFRRTLREVVAETVAGPEQVEEELAELRRYMG